MSLLDYSQRVEGVFLQQLFPERLGITMGTIYNKSYQCGYEKLCILTTCISKPAGYHLQQCDEDKYKVNKINVQIQVLNADLYNSCSLTCYPSDSFYEVCSYFVQCTH